MKLFVTVTDDFTLWPYFLEHYQKLGVKDFYVHTLMENVDPMASLSGDCPVLFSYNGDPWETFCGDYNGLTAIRLAEVKDDEWHVIADLDEFHAFDAPLDALTAEADQGGCNTVEVELVDRLAADGSLPPISGDIWKNFPVECHITRDLLKACDVKSGLVKGPLEAGTGHFSMVGGHPCSRRQKTHHFKWNANVIERLERRLWVLEDGKMKQETQEFLDHFKKFGRVNLEKIPENH
jgi:hypothetical protein